MNNLGLVTVLILSPQLVLSSLPILPASLRFNNVFNPFDSDRIVGGIAAKDGELPYQVSLQIKSLSGAYHHFCGGSLVTPDCVITAAHCATDRVVETLFVVGGTTSLESGVPLAVKDIQVNPDYDPRDVTNDIAVIKLASPVTFSDDLRPVAVATDKVQTAPETPTTVSGWGTTTEAGKLSDELLYTEVPIISDTDCRTKYGSAEIAESMICAGLNTGGKDSCQGDSGGPLVAGSGEYRKLVGIVSWGYGCARPEYPGVYTEVSYFTDFLRKQGCVV